MLFLILLRNMVYFRVKQDIQLENGWELIEWWKWVIHTVKGQRQTYME